MKKIDSKFEWIDAEEFRNRWLIAVLSKRGVL